MCKPNVNPVCLFVMLNNRDIIKVRLMADV